MMRRISIIVAGLVLATIGLTVGLAQSDDQAASSAPTPAADHAKGIDAYGVFRRDARSDDKLAQAPSGAETRKVSVDHYLLRRPGKELCVVAKPRSGDVGATGCSVERTAESQPPVVVLRSPDGTTHVYGAAPDDAVSVQMETGEGKSVAADIVDNGFTLELPGRYTSGRFVLRNGSRLPLPQLG